MSNANTDRLDKEMRLQRSKEILKGYEDSRACEGLAPADIEWLDKAIAAAKLQVEIGRKELSQWWT